jgi:hypothetical protein
MLWKVRQTWYAVQKAAVDGGRRSCESRDPRIGWDSSIVAGRASFSADGLATTSLLHALTIDVLEAGAEVVDVGILIKDTQTLVDHVWSQRGFGEFWESSSELLDDGVQGVVAGVKDAHCMVVSTVPFLG